MNQCVNTHLTKKCLCDNCGKGEGYECVTRKEINQQKDIKIGIKLIDKMVIVEPLNDIEQLNTEIDEKMEVFSNDVIAKLKEQNPQATEEQIEKAEEDIYNSYTVGVYRDDKIDIH